MVASIWNHRLCFLKLDLVLIKIVSYMWYGEDHLSPFRSVNNPLNNHHGSTSSNFCWEHLKIVPITHSWSLPWQWKLTCEWEWVLTCNVPIDMTPTTSEGHSFMIQFMEANLLAPNQFDLLSKAFLKIKGYQDPIYCHPLSGYKWHIQIELDTESVAKFSEGV